MAPPPRPAPTVRASDDAFAETAVRPAAARAQAARGATPEVLTAAATEIAVGAAEAPIASVNRAAFEARYADAAPLGQGGMGEVRAYVDQRIGREVAIKLARRGAAPGADVRRRFLREACIQGRLEHPAIVPVHDIGIGPDGEPFFSMKRVRGLALDEILEQLAADEPEAQARFTRRKLLSAFSQVCLAIDFAHRHGIVHRDLKPSNLMLGDFGEVYVLDWGLAKPFDAPDPAPEPAPRDSIPLPDEGLATVRGAILGTLGYMAPEQLDGRPLDGRTDVYALGATLFELLTLRPLHERSSNEALVDSTKKGPDIEAALRQAPDDVPPELLDICVRATALDPDARLDGARAVHEAIEAYLEGDRDLESRRRAARRHLAAAREALELAGTARDADEGASARAVRSVARALALDPEDPEATRALVGLLTDLPDWTPREVRERMASRKDSRVRALGRIGGWAFLAFFPLAPLLVWMGVRRWEWLVVGGLAIGASALLSFAAARRPHPPEWMQVAILALSGLGVATASVLFGPLLFLPAHAATFAAAYALKPGRPWRIAGTAVALALVVAPFAAWALGWLPVEYAFENGSLRITSGAIALPAGPTIAFLLAASIVHVLVASALTSRVHAGLDEAEARAELHTWRLRQLVPEQARDAVDAQETTLAPPNPCSLLPRRRD